MSKSIVVILGGNILNSGIVDYCKQHEYFVVVVDWSSNAALKGDLFLCIDVKDHASIINALHANGVDHIIGAYSSIDLAVASVNKINSHFGLSSMDEDALLNALAKSRMTDIWKQEKLLNRFSKVFTSFDDEIYQLVSQLKLIVKPNISSSSRGITILQKDSAYDVVNKAYLKAEKESYDSKVIVEEFVEGQEFTCEMLGDSNGNISVYAISVKYHTQNTDNNRIAIKLHYNSNVYSDEIYEEIASFGKACYRALGFNTSFGHLELIRKADGTLTPIEIGARSSGFIANPLVSRASGQDFFGDYLSILNGKIISGEDYINGNSSSMYFFYDMPSNTSCVNPCCLIDFVKNDITALYYNRQKIQIPGSPYQAISNDNERIGYEIIFGDRQSLTIQNIEEIEQNFIKHNING